LLPACAGRIGAVVEEKQSAAYTHGPLCEAFCRIASTKDIDAYNYGYYTLHY